MTIVVIIFDALKITATKRKGRRKAVAVHKEEVEVLGFRVSHRVSSLRITIEKKINIFFQNFIKS